MDRPALITTLKASIGPAADEFKAANDADFKRHLSYAARDYSRRRPRTLLDTLTLIADQSNYSAPAGLLQVKYSDWGRVERSRVPMWERSCVYDLPRLGFMNGEIWLTPAPTQAQITAFGSSYAYFYFAAHEVSEASVTVPDGDEMLLVLRAQAEAAKELMTMGIVKPIGGWRNGIQSIPKPMTPAEIYASLMDAFEKAAA